MGLFNRKKKVLPITVGSTVMANSLYFSQFIETLCGKDDFKPKIIDDIWSVIYASARQIIENQPEKDYLDQFLRFKIDHPLVLDAFNANLLNSQDALFKDLIRNSANEVNEIVKELTSEVLVVALESQNPIDEDVIADLTVPILRFHLSNHLGPLNIEQEFLAAVLAGGYALIVSRALNDFKNYGTQGLSLITKNANTIVAVSMTLYILKHRNQT